MRQHLLPSLALLLLLSGCPDREKVIDDVGGAPGRTLEKVRESVQEAHDQAEDRRKELLGDEG